MTASHSAGLLLHRRSSGSGGTEVLLVHPGGPFWARKDEGAWSIPKGEYVPEQESPREVAFREFREELGLEPPEGEVLDLGTVTQRGGKVVTAFCLAGDLDVTETTSNTFTMEWPPRSGKQAEFPEVDRAEWFTIADARVKLLPFQVRLLDRLVELLASE